MAAENSCILFSDGVLAYCGLNLANVLEMVGLSVGVLPRRTILGRWRLVPDAEATDDVATALYEYCECPGR